MRGIPYFFEVIILSIFRSLSLYFELLTDSTILLIDSDFNTKEDTISSFKFFSSILF